jgi:hypothetical protein
MGKSKTSRDGLVPDDWMPESMHHRLTCMELNIPHTPALLEQHSQMLDEAYQNHGSHFSYGMRYCFCIWYAPISYILTLHFYADYHSFTKNNRM